MSLAGASRLTANRQGAPIAAVACAMAGQKLELTPTSIRTLVADGLWALSHYGTTVVTAAAPATASRNAKN